MNRKSNTQNIFFFTEKKHESHQDFHWRRFNHRIYSSLMKAISFPFVQNGNVQRTRKQKVIKWQFSIFFCCIKFDLKVNLVETFPIWKSWSVQPLKYCLKDIFDCSCILNWLHLKSLKVKGESVYCGFSFDPSTWTVPDEHDGCYTLSYVEVVSLRTSSEIFLSQLNMDDH